MKAVSLRKQTTFSQEHIILLSNHLLKTAIFLTQTFRGQLMRRKSICLQNSGDPGKQCILTYGKARGGLALHGQGGHPTQLHTRNHTLTHTHTRPACPTPRGLQFSSRQNKRNRMRLFPWTPRPLNNDALYKI